MNFSSTSLGSQIIHNEKTQIKNDTTIKAEFLQDFEVLNSYDLGLKPKGPPFEGILKEFSLIKSKKTKENFILIKIKKNAISLEICEQIAFSCRKLKKFSHPHVLKLHKFEAHSKSEFLMIFELFTNKSLFELLKLKRTLMERKAFIYFTQLLLAVDFLHKKHIFHLNLSLKKLILDEKMDIKLVDFAYKSPFDVIYEAPECVNTIEKYQENPEEKTRKTEGKTQEKTRNSERKQGKSEEKKPRKTQEKPQETNEKEVFLMKKRDIWLLGVFLFELIHGYFPYKGKTIEGKQRSIMNGIQKKFASFISDEAKELISSILSQKPQERPFLKEILESRWIKKFEKLFHVEIKDFLHIENIRKISMKSQNSIDEWKKGDYKEKRKEKPNLKIIAEEFSFRMQDIKVRSSFELLNSNSNTNLKSFTFYKSPSISNQSPNSNTINSSSLMKSSQNSSNQNKNNKKKGILEEEFIKLKECKELDTGFIQENHKTLPEEKINVIIKEKKQNFLGKIIEILGCGCFNVKKDDKSIEFSL